MFWMQCSLRTSTLRKAANHSNAFHLPPPIQGSVLPHTGPLHGRKCQAQDEWLLADADLQEQSSREPLIPGGRSVKASKTRTDQDKKIISTSMGNHDKFERHNYVQSNKEKERSGWQRVKGDA
eukprot:5415847-Amphidinium_carterae.1